MDSLKKNNFVFYICSCVRWPDLAFKNKNCVPPPKDVFVFFVPFLYTPISFFLFVLHHHRKKRKKFIIIRVLPPIFIFFCAQFFFEFFVHCVCLVDRVRVIVDKTSGINETEKKIKIVLKYTLTLINQNAIRSRYFPRNEISSKKRSVKVSLDALSS